SVQVGIVNGTEAKPHSRPYMVSIQRNNKHKCGGFLVSERFVMTAAHCFEKVENLTVVVGAHDYTHGSRRMDVKFYHIHPGYDSKHLLNDIMLIQLHEKVNKSNNIKWISIPKKDKDIKAKTKVKCSVAGWGKKNTKGGASAKLMEVNVTIIDPKECKKYWGKDYSTSRMVCAGGHGGFCQGDSGGPLVCNNVAVGVVSYNEKNNCNSPKLPNVYTKISKFLTWIKAILGVVVGDDIINGKKASKNSLQYMVSVQYNKKHHCGGFLISPQYVLTAAHCASEKMTVVLGDHNISAQKNLKRYDVVDKFIPKTFKNVTMGNDIMLLKISRKAVLGGKVKTVTFPHQHYSIKNNTQCLVAGWGSTKERKTVNDLLTSNVSTVDIHDCKEAWKKYKENIT
ncbi:hypothetical protein QQF64_019116, partial [Cirrhinus molitorella]